MTREEMFHDYLLICSMKAPNKCKVQMLVWLFKNDSRRMRVIGVTREALNSFRDVNFKKINGIQRAHKNSRSETYNKMMTIEFKNCDEWWQFYYDHDETILATPSENIRNQFSKIYEINPSQGLFIDSGYGFSLRKQEKRLLEDLYNSEFLNKE